VVTDLSEHLERFGFLHARELIERKRQGELAALDGSTIERWRREIGRAFEVLDEALTRSPLPEEPRGTAALDAWLLGMRRRSW
jgi:hypothetical protein